MGLGPWEEIDVQDVWTGSPALSPPVGAPLPGRLAKPRREGLTVVMDKGLGLAATRDVLEVAAAHIDLWKLAFGTAALYPGRLLQEKIALVRSYGVDPYPGGTFIEAAYLQGRVPAVFEYVRRMGFAAVEISDGTIRLARHERRALIRAAREAGLRVLAEVGKKDPDRQPPPEALAEQGLLDLEDGAEYVIVEARESGRGVGIYDKAGEVKEDCLAVLAGALPVDRVIWEAPQKPQQQALILRFGANVSLGNVPPGEALALESLRQGWRGDTLALVT